jgi:hypothetical protein
MPGAGVTEGELFRDGIEEPLTQRERDSYWTGQWISPEREEDDADE